MKVRQNSILTVEWFKNFLNGAFIFYLSISLLNMNEMRSRFQYKYVSQA